MQFPHFKAPTHSTSALKCELLLTRPIPQPCPDARPPLEKKRISSCSLQFVSLWPTCAPNLRCASKEKVLEAFAFLFLETVWQIWFSFLFPCFFSPASFLSPSFCCFGVACVRFEKWNPPPKKAVLKLCAFESPQKNIFFDATLFLFIVFDHKKSSSSR